MKALSVRQPWAELIACGRKTVELRTWRVKYRGPLLIVSGAGAYRRAPELFGLSASLPRGFAVAVVDLVDVIEASDAHTPMACCDVSAGEYAWILRDAKRTAPEHVLGRLNLFEVPDSLAAMP